MSMLQTLIPTTEAKKTTGPATDAGRRASSRNSFKHGFSGSGKVLPDDLRDEVIAKRDAYADHFQPDGPIEAELVFQMALSGVRMFRIAKADEAQTNERVRHAVQRWDENRADEVRRLADRLDAEPAEAARLLRRIAEGTDFLADEWHALKDALEEEGSWTEARAVRALRLLGMNNEPGDQSTRGLADYWLDVEAAKGGDDSGRDALAAIADQQVEELVALGDQLWNQFDQPDRLDAPHRVLFDGSPEGLKRSRYLADAERLFYRSLNELNRLQAQRKADRRRAPSRLINPRPSPAAEAPRNEFASPPPRPLVPTTPTVAPKPAPAPSPTPIPPGPRNESIRPLLDRLYDAPEIARINLPIVPQRRSGS
ncbi:MAG: hypothetical protein ABI353_00770 [Isosphaeraceae bacterium]